MACGPTNQEKVNGSSNMVGSTSHLYQKICTTQSQAADWLTSLPYELFDQMYSSMWLHPKEMNVVSECMPLLMVWAASVVEEPTSSIFSVEVVLNYKVVLHIHPKEEL